MSNPVWELETPGPTYQVQWWLQSLGSLLLIGFQHRSEEFQEKIFHTLFQSEKEDLRGRSQSKRRSMTRMDFECAQPVCVSAPEKRRRFCWFPPLAGAAGLSLVARSTPKRLTILQWVLCGKLVRRQASLASLVDSLVCLRMLREDIGRGFLSCMWRDLNPSVNGRRACGGENGSQSGKPWSFCEQTNQTMPSTWRGCHSAGLRDGSGCLACKQDCHTNWLCLFFSVPHTRWKYVKVITKKYFTGENIYALVKCFCISCVCNQHQFSTYYFHNMFSLFWHIKLICLHPNIIFRPQGHFLDPLKSRLVCS